MKTAFAITGSTIRIMAWLCVTLWLAGCATQRVDWPARIGHYTYDQAVVDMGPPDRQAKLADGAVVAEWLVSRGSTYVYGSADPYWPFYAGPVTAHTSPNRFLRLTFGPNGQLAAWTKVYK
ncbi:MAG TPA: hypothetical protein P5205_15505 [Candidatus Paceibacterota bacterium]|nr:hypothetical protein [Verrucomicrobiota bacterium]HSA11767.1 hypothetical protein [Candidatus Paceibacterota bacterium]